MKQEIIEAIKNALKKIGSNVDVELTPSQGHGDYSTNVAMKLAKKTNQDPLKVAQKIVDNLNANFISRVQIAKFGFINFFLSPNSIAYLLQKTLKQGLDYGKGNQNKYINVEYVSANPTGYLHIGHARNAALGSTLSNILKFAGNKVEQEYYINDAGAQIEILAKSTFIRYQQLLGKKVSLPKDAYSGQEINDFAKILITKVKNKYLKNDFEEVKDYFAKETKKYMLQKIKEHLKLFNVVMDIYYSETSLYDDKLIMPAIKKMKNVYQKDGATWLQTTKYGDDKDRVLIKNDGTFTYFAPDIAYHNVKILRGYDELINVWGADHISYADRMKIAIQELGISPEKLDIITIQMVRLVKDGKELKMSKRMGTSFTLIDLIKKVGTDVARFNLINRANTSKLDFDLNLATKKNNDNPVFSLQYTHARAHQLLEKSQVKFEIGTYEDPKEKAIINKISEFPYLIDFIANNHKVHLLPQYLIDLARIFNSFYSQTRIIGSPKEKQLLSLVLATKNVIAIGLKLIDVDVPNQM